SGEDPQKIISGLEPPDVLADLAARRIAGDVDKHPTREIEDLQPADQLLLAVHQRYDVGDGIGLQIDPPGRKINVDLHGGRVGILFVDVDLLDTIQIDAFHGSRIGEIVGGAELTGFVRQGANGDKGVSIR